jgi:hypothetical protein
MPGSNATKGISAVSDCCRIACLHLITRLRATTGRIGGTPRSGRRSARRLARQTSSSIQRNSPREYEFGGRHAGARGHAQEIEPHRDSATGCIGPVPDQVVGPRRQCFLAQRANDPSALRQDGDVSPTCLSQVEAQRRTRAAGIGPSREDPQPGRGRGRLVARREGQSPAAGIRHRTGCRRLGRYPQIHKDDIFRG